MELSDGCTWSIFKCRGESAANADPLVVIALLNLPVQVSNLVVPVLLGEESSVHPASRFCDLQPVVLGLDSGLSSYLASMCKVLEGG